MGEAAPARPSELRVRQGVDDTPGLYVRGIHTNFGVRLNVVQAHKGLELRGNVAVETLSPCCGLTTKLGWADGLAHCSGCYEDLPAYFDGDVVKESEQDALAHVLLIQASQVVGPVLGALASAGLMEHLVTHTIGVKPAKWSFVKEYQLYPTW